jgi:hypothetical protein
MTEVNAEIKTVRRNDLRWERPKFARWKLAVAATLILWILMFFLLRAWSPTGNAIQMQLHSDRAGIAQWFYDSGSGYSENESVTAPLREGENRVVFALPSGTIRALRFDPINNDAHVRIGSMRWVMPTAALVDTPGIGQFFALANIARIAPTADGIDVWPVAGSPDPQLQLALARPLELTSPRSFVGDGLEAFALACALLLAACLVTRLRIQQIVIAGMALALGLILTMACISSTTQSAHPDEFSHLPAFHYFTQHLLPPAVDDPAVVPSLSIYGASYLFEMNVTYLIAAKVTTPVIGWFASEVSAARAFQCLLWMLLILFVLRDRGLALPFSVVLLSPQVWYIFSYFNSDALPLFLALVAVMLLSGSRNAVHAYLANERKISASVVLFALCLGLLLISKANYLVLVPGLLLWLAVLHLDLRWRELLATLIGLGLLGASMFLGKVPALSAWHAQFASLAAAIALIVFAAFSACVRALRDAALRQRFLRLIAVCALAMTVVAPRVLLDFSVNGTPSSKSARMTAVEEKYAGPGFKPSQVTLGNGTTNTALNIKGVSLGQMLFDSPFKWLQTNMLSSLGVYGYMTVFAPYSFYICLAALLCAIALLGAIALARSRSSQDARLLALATGICLLAMLSSILQSWVFDFQPQGRYLFPMLAVLALVLGRAAPKIPSAPFKIFLVGSLALSVYSFLCIALPVFMHASGGS